MRSVSNAQVAFTMKSNIHCAVHVTLVVLACVHSLYSVPLQVSQTSQEADSVDGVENTAKLLINLDQDIEKVLQAPVLGHFYLAQSEETLTNGSDSNGDREEKFSLVLQDLTKIEDQIKDAISKANTNRQYRLVMRLRPLLSYVNHIHRNMEMLRTRVVAIATLSNLAVTVTEVLDQFGDVMTSSLGLSSGIVPPKDRVPATGSASVSKPSELPKASSEPAPTTPGSSPVPEAGTTLSYTEVDSENFLKKIINQEGKK